MVQEGPEADPRRRAASIEINRVTKIFRDGRGTGGLKALDGASCSIAPGEFVCILGPSGCGKSTLLNILSGLDEHYEGSASIHGRPVRRGADRRRLPRGLCVSGSAAAAVDARCARTSSSRSRRRIFRGAQWRDPRSTACLGAGRAFGISPRVSSRCSCPAACSSAPRSRARSRSSRTSC